METKNVKTIDIVYTICEKSKNYNSIEKFIKDYNTDLKNIKKICSCDNELQALFICLILFYETDRYASIKKIAEHFNIPTLKMFLYFEELTKMFHKNTIYFDNNRRNHRSRSKSTRIKGKSIKLENMDLSENVCLNKDIVASMLNNEVYVEKGELKAKNLITLLEKIHDLFQERFYNEDEYLFHEMMSDISILIEEHKNLKTVKKIKTYINSLDDIALLLYLATYKLFEDENKTIAEMFEIFSCSKSQKIKKINQFVNKKHILFKNNWIGFVKDNNVSERSELEITNEGLEYFENALPKALKNKANNNDYELIIPKEIKPKEMFYEGQLEKDIKFIAEIISINKYPKIKKRLSDVNMPTGMSIIFHGKPGTGKTETAYQLAKQMNRPILMVDISKTKTCWYGESERITKKIFDKYKEMVAKYKNEFPILLLNEADAIIGKRIDGVNSSTAHTENALKNIILQEIENLEGILIATTNLTNNIDPAFERRFLFKVDFPAPSINLKKKIWTSKLPNIPKEIIDKVAINFEFSGAQIENIAKKVTMQYILTGKYPDKTAIMTMCNNEKFENKNKINKIGYCM